MTNQIAPFQEKPLLANKIELTPISLSVIGELNKEEESQGWKELARIQGGIQRWVGDYYNDTKKYGRSIELAEEAGLEPKTVRNDGYVMSRVEVSRRRDTLSFGHEAEVAKFDADEQEKWLEKADRERWSVQNLREEIKEDERLKERLARLESAPAAPRWDGNYQPNNIYIADTTKIDFIDSVPKDSMDMLFTDPPWDEEALICYETAGRLANRVLKPGGFVAIYCGKMFLPEILSMLSSWLDYVWMYCVFQPDNNWSMTRSNVGIFETWRPIALFRKPGDYREQRFAPDALKCTRQKQWHDWQQGIEPIEKYIELLTEPGDIVLDPFVGGATVPYAAKRLKRHYLAFDKEEETVRLALARLNGNMESEGF